MNCLWRSRFRWLPAAAAKQGLDNTISLPRGVPRRGHAGKDQRCAEAGHRSSERRPGLRPQGEPPKCSRFSRWNKGSKGSSGMVGSRRSREVSSVCCHPADRQSDSLFKWHGLMDLGLVREIEARHCWPGVAPFSSTGRSPREAGAQRPRHQSPDQAVLHPGRSRMVDAATSSPPRPIASMNRQQFIRYLAGLERIASATSNQAVRGFRKAT